MSTRRFWPTPPHRVAWRAFLPKLTVSIWISVALNSSIRFFTASARFCAKGDVVLARATFVGIALADRARCGWFAGTSHGLDDGPVLVLTVNWS
jgi:hypothetical protein